MKTSETSRRIVSCVVGAAALAIPLCLPTGVSAQEPTTVEIEPFRVEGYQASSNAPFILEDSRVFGDHATLAIVDGPIASSQTLVIPPAALSAAGGSDFGGGTCTAEYTKFAVTGVKASGDGKKSSSDIDIYSWSFGCTNDNQTGGDGGAGAGKSSIGEIHIGKVTDGAGVETLGITGVVSITTNPDGSAILHLQGNWLRRKKVG